MSALDVLSLLNKVAAFIVCFLCCVEGSLHTTQNVTGIAGGSLLLNCTVGVHDGQVTWLRPGDNAIMSRDYSILNVEGERRRNRLMIVGDYSKGEFHLLIRYTLFPQDAGTWLCTSEPVTHRVNVLLLVRPTTEVPSISPSGTPSSVEGYQGNASEHRTFTCTSHFAFPPVQLSWVKEFGVDVPYHVTLPSIVVSRSGAMSSSVRLVLSRSNAGSLFVCVASHPTFFGKVFSASLPFHLSAGADQQPLVQESVEAKTLSARASLIHLDTLDRVFLLLVITIILTAIVVGGLMNKFHSKWELDVPLDRIDQNLNTKVLCEVVDGEKVKRYASAKGRQRFTSKVLSGLVLLLVLIGSLVFAFPIYYKSVTIPTVDADEIASVMAGSALWLDCRMLVHPPTSVLEITWLYNEEPFYYQYYMNGQNIGFPHNSTKGFMMGMRVSSQGLGQVTIWPVAPGEDGQYACQAFVSSGDAGVTEERRKTTAVFVLMGPIVNYGLIGMLAVALLSSLGLLVLFISHSLRITRKEEEDKVDDEDV